MGPGIEPGTVDDPVRPMDLAPTLAQIAGIPFPDDLDGKPLVPKKN
jgi:arylsulfatase A-like enzyme